MFVKTSVLSLLVLLVVSSSAEKATQAVSRAVNEFTHAFLKQLDYANKNVVYSPASIAVALGMLLKGARGQTAEEILKALQLKQDTSSDQIHLAFKQILTSEESRKKDNLTLELANLAVLAKEYPFEKSYAAFLRSNYEALLKEADFEREALQATNEINQFVNKKTHGLIKKVFEEPVDSSTKFVLVNTIYFKGVFKNKFLNGSTEKQIFHNADKSDSQVDTMYQESHLNSVSNDQLVLFELPYRGNVSLYVIVPKERYGLPLVLKSLKADDLENLLGSLKFHHYKLYFPKFSYEFQPKLKDVLQALGAKKMFQQGAADLTGISKSRRLYVTEAVHKAKILMNEGGTEAAGVTAIVGGVRLNFPQKSIEELRVDHPFAYIIRDRVHNVNLFAGAVNKL